MVWWFQVKGVGMCGHFRLFGESDEDKENKKVKSEEEATGDEVRIYYKYNLGTHTHTIINVL